MIAHRASVLGAVDHVLVLNQGRQQAFGLKDEVLRPAARPSALPLKVVAPTRAEAS